MALGEQITAQLGISMRRNYLRRRLNQAPTAVTETAATIKWVQLVMTDVGLRWLAAAMGIVLCAACSTSHPAKVRQIVPPAHPAITRADDGKTITLHVGQTMTIFLQGQPWTDADPGGDYWLPPFLDTSGIVTISSARGGYPTYSYAASITGVKLGTTLLGATHGVECLFWTKTRCVPPVSGISITLRVT